MNEQDIFVGIVAVLTGLFVIASAVSNSKWINRFWIARRLSETSNSSVSRVVVFAIGFLCALLGVLLLLGFFPSTRDHGDGGSSNRDEAASLWNVRMAKLATGR